ncbi:uncharacterized protein J3D65DRAFT_624810 [Phyllosticta citribraziliensis]|uniref:Uncharacterized protein n=1 Tax=Phyllosticta citribraziliensis TaxID=989973 RepID=A0ABR1LT71_9PEZI
MSPSQHHVQQPARRPSQHKLRSRLASLLCHVCHASRARPRLDMGSRLHLYCSSPHNLTDVVLIFALPSCRIAPASSPYFRTTRVLCTTPPALAYAVPPCSTNSHVRCDCHPWHSSSRTVEPHPAPTWPGSPVATPLCPTMTMTSLTTHCFSQDETQSPLASCAHHHQVEENMSTDCMCPITTSPPPRLLPWHRM